MRCLAVVLLLAGWSLSTSAAGALAQGPPAQAPAGLAQPAPPQTEHVGPNPSSAGALRPDVIEPGALQPSQVQALLHQTALTVFRVTDLLTEVHPAGWKLSSTASLSFGQMLESLRSELRALDDWRSRFEEQSDNVYLGFETYAAIGAVLPRLHGVARSIGQHENASLASQYSQAENKLFDLQQALRPYLGLLLRDPDQGLRAVQNNLASCEARLTYAMRPATLPARPMKNLPPLRPQVRVARRRPPAASGVAKPAPSGKNPPPQAGAPNKPGAMPANPPAAPSKPPTRPIAPAQSSPPKKPGPGTPPAGKSP